MDKTKIDLNKPAFGSEAQKVEELEVTPTSESQPEPEIKSTEEAEPEIQQEEQRVPYSRFSQMRKRAIDGEQEAREWRAKAEAKTEIEPISKEMPSYWKENFGDTEAAQIAWENQLKLNEAIKQEAREYALQGIKQEREQEILTQQENLRTLESNLEDLSDFLGRELTEKEQNDILDIVDEYTPKDNSGNYLGVMIPFDKAWEIYELKQEAQKAPKKQSRDAVAKLSGNNSDGETSVQIEKDKNFNPFAWDDYRKRL